MVPGIVKELFQTAPPDILSEELPSIMGIICNLGEKDGKYHIGLYYLTFFFFFNYDTYFTFFITKTSKKNLCILIGIYYVSA